jgi:hypothetical protein
VGKGLRDRPIDELSLSELVLRFHLYIDHLSADEHARLRGAFERALERESSSPGGWGCLAVLYSHEWLVGLNPLPDLLSRERRAAARAIALDPHDQRALAAVVLCASFDRDLLGVETECERIVAANPHSRVVGSAALWLAFAGQTDRTEQLMSGVAALNPKHPTWFNLIPFLAAYHRGDFEHALISAKRMGMTTIAWGILAVMAAAGQLGRRVEARESLDALGRSHPQRLDVAAARQEWARAIWDEGFVNQLMDGYQKAWRCNLTDGLIARRRRTLRPTDLSSRPFDRLAAQVDLRDAARVADVVERIRVEDDEVGLSRPRTRTARDHRQWRRTACYSTCTTSGLTGSGRRFGTARAVFRSWRPVRRSCLRLSR